MVKRLIVIISVSLACATLVSAQSTASPTTQSTRTRVVAPKPTPTPRIVIKSADPEAGSASQKRTQAAPSSGVVAAFNNLLDGIRHADVKAATGAYQNTPRLVLFNYNGTVTRGWDQLKQNREASYPEMKDVKLEVKDLRVIVLGRDAALITCQWTQSMTFRGTPETDSGRMTIVFRKVGATWKAIHLHTSPDRPDPSRIPPSEQTATPPKSTP
ncbi:MAG: SnoaL-like domain [Blastocatellia bacterium]|nr:SnoaL-like domain [Blastocatellia bacterium]